MGRTPLGIAKRKEGCPVNSTVKRVTPSALTSKPQPDQ
jgi:hypothetical protein